MLEKTKRTSKMVASIAGRVLRDKNYSKDVKALAGSALSQARPNRKK